MCIVSLAIGLVACTYREDDISDEPRASQIIGAKYKVIGDITAFGVRQNSRAAVEYIVLKAPPGFDGPEVGFTKTVPLGTEITVLKVRKANRFLENPYILMVRLDGTNLDPALPIKIELFGNNGGDSRISLNPEFYERIASTGTNRTEFTRER